MPDDEASEKGHPLEEYKELCNNMRHYGNMRFAQLTIFSTIMGALFAFVTTNGNTLCPQMTTLLDTAIMIIAAMFWIMEERAADYWHHFRRRAKKIEEDVLGFDQYKRKPPEAVPCFVATNATRVLFTILPLFLIFTVERDFCKSACPMGIWFLYAIGYWALISVNIRRLEKECKSGC